jgi:2-iminobutanoate/2-iminopropanoate deaminase
MSELRVVSTPDAPAAIGPYSQAIVSGDWIFTSGQIPLDPKTGALQAEGIVAQTHQVLKNLSAVLAAAGGDLGSVVRTTVFLADIADFAAMNEVYAGYFGEHHPARTTVQAAALPRSVRVEIDAVARVAV